MKKLSKSTVLIWSFYVGAFMLALGCGLYFGFTDSHTAPFTFLLELFHSPLWSHLASCRHNNPNDQKRKRSSTPHCSFLWVNHEWTVVDVYLGKINAMKLVRPKILATLKIGVMMAGNYAVVNGISNSRNKIVIPCRSMEHGEEIIAQLRLAKPGDIIFQQEI